MRKLTHTLLALMLCLTQFACATHALHSSNSVSRTENINSFLITEDGHTLIIAGDEHHFIFPLGEPLKSLLTWPGRGKLQPSFTNFEVNAGQSIQGHYTLSVDLAQVTAAEQQFLHQQGFAPAGYGKLAYEADIKGTRYFAGSVRVPQTARFRQPYPLKVREPEGAPEQLAKLALTPVTLAVDGVTVLLGGAVLAPVGMGMLLGCMDNGCR